jgi:hypothetical protein
MNLSEKKLAITLLVGFLIAMGLVGNADYADAVAEEQFYKQMVCEGKWPDYKNLGVDCEDIQERVSGG